MKKRLFSLFLVLALALSLFPAASAAKSDLSDQLEEYIVAALDSKKINAKPSLSTDENLLPLFTVSDTAYDWAAMSIGRFGYRDADGYHFLYHDGDGYEEYLEAMKDDVAKKYVKYKGKLHRAKATEWHRLILAVNALGGDPTRFSAYDGTPIDLVNDGTYNHEDPGYQGINGSIFALIALDSKNYDVPSNAVTTRAQFIENILALQLADGVNDHELGGWDLSKDVSDPDLTAMAIQALAPYYEDDTTYTYTNTKLGAEVTQTVGEAVDAALDRLSSLQRDEGDFASWGTVNVESTAQVLVALCALGIDPAEDERFIKEGNTLLDGILKYRLSDGGFAHAYGAPDPDNPTAVPGQFNNMATDQATYALVAYWRFVNGYNSLYDMASDWPEDEYVTVTLSVEADTLGLGYLVEPTQIDVPVGTKASAVLTQLLRENGYTWDNTGTVRDGFYLTGISPVDQTNATVAPYSLELMGEEDVDYDAYRGDTTLGEKDYSEQSGWMYYVDDVAADKGPADWIVSDGEVLRWRFSVYGYGADLEPATSVPEPSKPTSKPTTGSGSGGSTAADPADEEESPAEAPVEEPTPEVGLPDKHPDVTVPPVVVPGVTFPDISGENAHPNQAAIEALASRGILTGKPDGTFDPDSPMSRAEFAALVVRALGLTERASQTENAPAFTDVSANDWFAAYVAAASDYGLINGKGDGTFDPAGLITRQEAAAMVARAAKLCGMSTDLDAGAVRDVLAQFSDYVQSPDWALQGLAFCYDSAIWDDAVLEINGVEALRRCDLAQTLFRLLKEAKLL